MPAVADVITGTPPLQWGGGQTANQWLLLSHNGAGSQASVTGLIGRRIDNLDGIPGETDWNNAINLGTLISEGPNAGTVGDPSTGDWNHKFRGAPSHAQICKKGDVYYLFLIAGNSEAGVGEAFDARNRRIGVYTSNDRGSSWTPHASNPLNLTYNLPSSTGEAGAFGAVGFVDPNNGNRLNLYYGSMTEFAANSVNCEIRLAELQDDGFTVDSDNVIIPFNAPVVGSGDEIWPWGVGWDATSSKYFMYYGVGGVANSFRIHYMEADDKTFQTNRTSQLLGSPNTYLTCAVAGAHASEHVVVAHQTGAPSPLTTFTAPFGTPEDLGVPVSSYTPLWNSQQNETITVFRG